MPEQPQPQPQPQKQKRARKARPKAFSNLTFAEKLRFHPFYSVWALGSLLFWMLPGVITIIYYVLPTPPFIPAVAMRGFAFTTSVLVSMIALGAFFFIDTKSPPRPLSERTLQQHLNTAYLTFVCVILFGFMWLLFLNGPASLVLHLVAPKESRSMTEQVAKTDYVRWRDSSCRGLWVAELEGSNALWSRRMCGITYNNYNDYRDGGTVKLDGKVSWFGIQYDAYAFEPSDGQQKKP
jgi:hypothetical protein